MKISKLFHWLYASIMFLPILVIPIFAINIFQKDVEPISIEVQEKQFVDFNQMVLNGNITQSNGFNTLSTGTITYYQNYLTYEATSPYSNNGIVPSNLWNLKYETSQTLLLKVSVTNINSVSNSYFLGSPWFSRGEFTLNTNETREFTTIITGSDFKTNGCQIALGSKYTNTFINIELHKFEVFNLTQMGLGDITIEEFDSMFPDFYYPYTDSQKELVNKPNLTIYDDTDIGSQYLYSLYKPVNDYFNFNKLFGLNDVYDWFQLNFFNGNAPISFTIVFNLLIYWLFISLFWLLFDVFMYVPQLVHRWLDKGVIE